MRRGVLWDRSPSSPPLRAEAALRPRPLARRAGRAAVAAQVELNADLAGGVSFDEFIQFMVGRGKYGAAGRLAHELFDDLDGFDQPSKSSTSGAASGDRRLSAPDEEDDDEDEQD